MAAEAGSRDRADGRHPSPACVRRAAVGRLQEPPRRHHPRGADPPGHPGARCRDADCPRYRASLRSEQEGRFALPQHEFGLDVIATVGTLRHAEHRSVPEIRRLRPPRRPDLRPERRQPPGPLRRAARLSPDRRRAHPPPHRAGRAGDPGHRRPAARRRPRGALGHPRRALGRGPPGPEPAGSDARRPGRSPRPGPRCAGRAGLARRDLRRPAVAGPGDRSGLPRCAPSATPVPLSAARRPGRSTRPTAVPRSSSKHVRGVRPIERSLEGRDDAEAAARGQCAAVRSALTDDGRPPLEASGLKLEGRRAAAASLDRVEARGSRRR